LQGDDGRPLPEPLAADARVDGKRGALLKLAAGLLGGTAQADGESLVSGIRAASALDLCGAVWAAGGDAQRAESAWRDALQRLPAERGSPIARALRARLLSRLGRTPEAQQELDAIAASGLRDSRYLPVATVAGAP